MQDGDISGCGTAISCNARGNETNPVKLRVTQVKAIVARGTKTSKTCFKNEKARLEPGFSRVQVSYV
jgi:hypothetical protein